MPGRVVTALKAAARAIEDAFGWLVLWWPLAPVSMVIGAVCIAVFSQSGDTFAVRFAAGLVTITFYLVAIFGSLLSAIFFTGVTWKLSQNRGASRPPKQRSKVNFDTIFWLLGSIITALWLAPLTLATAHIPVVRDQILPF
jgi:heme/copper-type cytochrome/quinol oxidase subunit 2